MSFAGSCAKNGTFKPTGESIEDAFAHLRAGDMLGRQQAEPRARAPIEKYRAVGIASSSDTGGLVRVNGDDIAPHTQSNDSVTYVQNRYQIYGAVPSLE